MKPEHTKFPRIKDQKTQLLIAATIKVISQYGLSQTTISRVTREAGMSAGIVNFYFANKQGLLLGTLTALDAEFQAQIEYAFNSESDPEHVLNAVIQTYFSDTLCDIDKIAVWAAFSSESKARKDYMAICAEHDHWFHERLREQFDRLCSRDGFGASSALALSRGFEGLLDGLWQDYLYAPEKFDRQAAMEIAKAYLGALFSQQTNTNSDQPENRKVTSSYCDKPLTEHMPTWAYYDQEVHELEKEVLFRPNWLLVGHQNDIPSPGDYMTLDALGERALVLRDHQGEIQAYHNVCRHRGAKLVDQDTGRCGHALSCPFHGWTYQLDGSLIGVPAEKTFEGLNKANIALVELELEIWMGFVFIRFETGGQSLAEVMAPVADKLAPYRMEDLAPVSDSRYSETLPYNWKVIHDIDNEGYHVPIGHPGLNQLYGKTYKDSSIEGIAVASGIINQKPAKNWSVRNYQKFLPDYAHLPEENQNLWFYATVFPSMVFGLYPDSVEFYMTIPISTDKTLYRGAIYSLEDDRREATAARYLNKRINRTTGREDESYVRWLQDGMRSSAFPPPRLSSIESGVQHFHNRIQEVIPVTKLADHPGPGNVRNANELM